MHANPNPNPNQVHTNPNPTPTPNQVHTNYHPEKQQRTQSSFTHYHDQAQWWRSTSTGGTQALHHQVQAGCGARAPHTQPAAKRGDHGSREAPKLMLEK